jgi:MarC family membrane protein
MEMSFTSAVVILLLVMDPIGNIPLFIALLRPVEPSRRTGVIVRECGIAYAVILIFVLFGERILSVLGLSGAALQIAGGLILFLIALRMIFRRPEGLFGDVISGEPFIVPLAIPSIAGPTAIATVMLMVSRAPHRMLEWMAAATIAMAITLAVLVFAERLSKWIGDRGLLAFERLMGLILTAIAVEMLLQGVQSFVQQL